jgi:hypothetical protein
VKLEKVATAGASENIDDALGLLLAFHRHIDDVMPVAQGLLVIVQSRSFVGRQLRDPQQPGA